MHKSRLLHKNELLKNKYSSQHYQIITLAEKMLLNKLTTFTKYINQK